MCKLNFCQLTWFLSVRTIRTDTSRISKIKTIVIKTVFLARNSSYHYEEYISIKNYVVVRR